MLRALGCAVICLFVFSSARADTFTLTSGGAATGFDLFSINAGGTNILIQGAAGGDPGNLTFATCTPAPCGPGAILNVGGLFSASQLNIGFSRGIVTINGTTFTNVVFSGSLNLTGSIVLPADFVNDHPVSVPFTMVGQLQGLSPCPVGAPAPCPQAFDISLLGSGTATANFQFFGARSVVYAFSAPVPEPATLGLFGIGLLALDALRKHRRR